MAHPQIILPACFSNLSPGKMLIPDEPLHHLSQLKFNGEDGTFIIEQISNFLKFCEHYEINENMFLVRLSSTPFQVMLNDGVILYHLLPSITFIISSSSFINPLIGMITKIFLKGSIS